MNTTMKQAKLWMIVVFAILCSCSSDDIETVPQKDYFTLWNTCEALTVLQDYVSDVTDPNSNHFIKEEDRIVTFDMDGTFIGELYPTYFEFIIKNLKTNKVLQISQEIGKVPVLSFGNSSGDEAMHNYCLGNQKYRTATFMLVADDDVRDHADLEEGDRREAKWRSAGYHVISMKNDFKTIYGEGVKKTEFKFD